MGDYYFKRSKILGLDTIKDIYLVKDEDKNIVCAVDSLDKYDELMESVSWWRDSEELITDKVSYIDNADEDDCYYCDEYDVYINDNDRIVNVEYNITRAFEKTKGIDIGNVYRIVSVEDFNENIPLKIRIRVPQFVDHDPEDMTLITNMINNYLNSITDIDRRKSEDNIKIYNQVILDNVIDD